MKNLPLLLKEIKADLELDFLELTIKYTSIHSSQLIIILNFNQKIIEVPVLESDIFRIFKERAVELAKKDSS